MLSPSSTDDEPTSIIKIMHDFSSKMRSGDTSLKQSGACKQKLSFSEDESSFCGSEKRSRFHDPLSSSIGRKRFAYERGRELSSLEEENASLREALSTLRQESIADKSSLSKLSASHRNGELASKRYLLEARSETKDYRLKYEKELLTSKALQEEINTLKKKVKSSVTSSSSEQDSEDQSLKKKLSACERQISELRAECFKGKKALESSEESRVNATLKLETENSSLAHKLRLFELQEKEREEQEGLMQKKTLLNAQLEKTVEGLKGEVLRKETELRGLRGEAAQNKEALLQRNAMRSQLEEHPRLLKRVESLQKENELLRSTQDNVSLLKEKISCLEAQLGRSQAGLEESRQSREELYRLQKVTKAWDAVVRRMFSSSEEEEEEEGSLSPEVLSNKLAELQRADLLLRSSLGEAMTDKKLACSRIVGLMDSLTNVKADNDKLNEFIQDQAKKVKKLQRKLLLLAKERDSYKSLLESYEHEVTFAGGQIEKDRISVLERVLADHKDMISKLEEKLESPDMPIVIGGGETTIKSDESEDKLQALKKDLEAALHERDHLRYELDNRAIKGDYNPHNTKVIQFKNNPMAEASDNVSSKVDKLQEENQSLKMRIKLMEEGQMRDLTLLSNQKVEEGISPKEVEELQSKVKSWEKKNERLMEAFKKTSKDFRKLTTELTGYRINSDPGEQFYRVSSVYSDSPEIEALLFKRDDKGELLLLQNDYAEALGHLIKVHLDTQDSIPAFLAGLTLDLMAKTQSFEADEDEPICID